MLPMLHHSDAEHCRENRLLPRLQHTGFRSQQSDLLELFPITGLNLQASELLLSREGACCIATMTAAERKEHVTFNIDCGDISSHTPWSFDDKLLVNLGICLCCV
jgi:hypothetical protein